MKIRIISDLHLEFHNWTYKNCGEDVIIIAGDIVSHTTKHGKPLWDLLKSIDIPIFFTLGNHDFYGGEIDKIAEQIKEKAAKIPNCYFLYNSYVDFNGFRFCGSPLFTDFNLNTNILDKNDKPIGNQRETMFMSKLYISDFKWIKNISPENYVKRANEAVDFFVTQTYESQLPLIFITHWIPWHRFIAKKYEGDILNGYFVNDCVDNIIRNDEMAKKIKLWAYGHTHQPNFLKMESGTQFICNPRGYPDENSEWNENLIIEI